MSAPRLEQVEPVGGEPVESEETSLTVGAFWLLTAKTIAFVLSTALPLLVVRRLDQDSFGLYKQVFLVVGTLSSVLPFGFSMSAFYFLPRNKEQQGAVVLNVVLIHAALGLLALLVLVFFPGVLGLVFGGQPLGHFAPQIGLLVFLWLLSSILDVIPMAHREHRAAAVFIVGAQLTKAVSLLAVVIVVPTVMALVYATAVHCVIQTVVLFVYLRSRFPNFLRSFDWGFLKTQLVYAAPYGVLGVLFSIQSDLHNYFVANQYSPAAFAVYSVGCFQLPLISILQESLAGVLIPRICILEKDGQHREVVIVSVSVMRKLASVFFPIFACLMVVGPEFLTILFTDRFSDSWPIFAINLTALPLSILLIDPIQRAYTQLQGFYVAVRVASIVGSAIGLYFVTRNFGLVGAITVVVVSSALQKLIVAVRLGSLLGVKLGDIVLLKDVGKLAVASALAAGAAGVVHSVVHGKPIVVLLACCVVFGTVYLLAVLGVGVLNESETAMVRAQVARFARVRMLKRA